MVSSDPNRLHSASPLGMQSSVSVSIVTNAFAIGSTHATPHRNRTVTYNPLLTVQIEAV